MSAPGTGLTQFTVRASADLAAWLTDRAARAGTAEPPPARVRTEMRMLRDLMDAEARRLPLTVAEASALAEVVGGALVADAVGGLLWAETADAFRLAREAGEETSYAAHYGIDEAALLTRLGRLGPAGDLAIRDALSRWWAAGANATAGGFREAGLRIREPERGLVAP